MKPFNRKNSIMIVVVVLMGLLLAGCGDTGAVLTYRVAGTAEDAHIAYRDAAGGMQDEIVDLPWEINIEFMDEFDFDIVVMNKKPDGDVSCKILMDGEEIGDRQSVAYTQCSGSVSKSAGSNSHVFRGFSVESYLNDATEARKAQNFEAALAETEKAIELAPYYAEPYFIQGVIYHQMENWEQSLTAFTHSIDRKPNDKESILNRSLSYSKLGNEDLAISDLTSALEIDPEYVLAYFNRAISYYNLGDYEAAQADVIKVQELSDDPDKIAWAEDVLGLIESVTDAPAAQTSEESQSTADATVTETNSEVLSEYLNWRDVIFSVTGAQVDVVTDQPNQVYGMIMDVGLSDDFIITITAFPTGESSLRTTVGGGAIGLGNDEYIAEHAKYIVTQAQSLMQATKLIDNYNLPKSQKVYFYFLTTSGLMLAETSLEEVNAPDHPFHELFVQFTEIKARSEELTDSP